MLSAFQAQPIHELKPKDKAKIESLLAYGDRLLVGLSTGALRIYRVNEEKSQHDEELAASPPVEAPVKQRAVELLREEEKFSKKPVQQLAIVKEANQLVSLSDGYVSLHDLQTYGLIERIEKTKGALCFAVTSNVIKDNDIPTLVSRLAVGVKRKLLCWTWTDTELSSDIVELTLEGAVKTLTWSSETSMAVGMDAGFSVVDLVSQEVTLVNKSRVGARADPAELAGSRFAAVSSSGMGYMGMASWVPKPMCTRIGGEELLFAKDVNTLFTDRTGMPTEKRQVPWSHAPEAIGYSYPYLLALQQPERGVLQIRNPDSLNLLQSISVPQATILHVPQPRISLAHAGKGFLVASERTIWRMNALSYPSQITELVEKGRFDEAVSLLSLLEDTLIDDKYGRIREVQIKKAESLFHDRKYRPALDLFTDAQAPVDRVVRLYPSVVAGELSSLVEEAESDEDVTSQEVEDPFGPSTPSKSVLGRFRVTQTPRKDALQSPKKNEQPSAKKDSDNSSVLSPRADADNLSIRSKTPATKVQEKALHGEDLKLAVLALCSFLAQSRTQLQKYLTTDGVLKEQPVYDPDTHKPQFANLLSDSLYDGPGPWRVDWQEELVKTAQTVDTILFRSYMLARPALAGSLFRVDNFCNPDVVQASLYENERYSDLIDFLHGKKRHRQALEMLQKFGKNEAEGEVPQGLNGPDRSVAYLKQLPSELLDLVLEFATWPISVDKELGLSIFTADSDNAERMDRKRVDHFLANYGSELEQRYLEHIIDELHEDDPDFHQKLIEIYIHSVKAGGDDRDKLETFLRSSTRYNRGQTFRLLDTENSKFHESRAIVLTDMGNYKQALSIYVYQIGDFDKAEEHCSHIYVLQQKEKEEKENLAIQEQTRRIGTFAPRKTEKVETVEEDDNVFAMLLGLYLQPAAGEQKRWPQALELLSKHGSRLPASSTLALMPDDLAVQELHDYFRGRMRYSIALARKESVVKGLEAVRRTKAEATLLLGDDGYVPQGRNKRVVVREDDHCKVCHKRFGASAVRAWPDGSVTHYGCVLGKNERPRGW